MAKALQGGTQLAAKLEQVRKKLENAASLHVGFLEDSNQPDGTPNAYIALIQEFGATINAQARTQIIYRKPRRLRKGKKGNQFVKASSRNAVAKEIDVDAHTIVIPARPFFRSMIAQNQDSWGPELAALLKQTNYDAQKALNLLGEKMGDQLRDSIENFVDPPNAKSTIRKKKFDKPLIDKGDMQRGVGFKVNAGDE